MRSAPSSMCRRTLARAALVSAFLLIAGPGAGAAEAAVSKPLVHGTTTSVRWQQRAGVGSFWKVTRMYRNGYTITRFEGYSCVLTCAYEGPTYVRTVGHGHTFWFLLVGGKLIPM